MNDKQLILGQVGPTMSMNSAQHPLKNNEGVGPSQNVFFFPLACVLTKKPRAYHQGTFAAPAPALGDLWKTNLPFRQTGHLKF